MRCSPAVKLGHYRISAGLGLFYQRFDRTLQFLNNRHDLTPFLIRDLQFFHDLGATHQGGRSFML
jgi:hypothetical protein